MMNSQNYNRLLQVTDLHLFGDKNAKFLGISPYIHLLQTIEHIKRHEGENPAELLLLTGDISQDYSLFSYENALNAINGLHTPFLVIPGNHDDDDVLQQRFAKHATNNHFFNLSLPLHGDWHAILLNSHWQKHIAGMLADKTLTFLRNELALHRDKNIMIFLHHHVLPLNSKWIDKLGLLNAQQFLDIVALNSNVRAVFSGHVHQESHNQYQHIDFYTTPAIAVQFTPQTPTFSLDKQMPGYRVIDLLDNGEYATQVVRIGYNSEFIPDINVKGY